MYIKIRNNFIKSAKFLKQTILILDEVIAIRRTAAGHHEFSKKILNRCVAVKVEKSNSYNWVHSTRLSRPPKKFVNNKTKWGENEESFLWAKLENQNFIKARGFEIQKAVFCPLGDSIKYNYELLAFKQSLCSGWFPIKDKKNFTPPSSIQRFQICPDNITLQLTLLNCIIDYTVEYRCFTCYSIISNNYYFNFVE